MIKNCINCDKLYNQGSEEDIPCFKCEKDFCAWCELSHKCEEWLK